MTSTTYYSPSHDRRAYCQIAAACALGFTGGLWMALLLPGACERPHPAVAPPPVTVRAVGIPAIDESAMLWALSQVESGGNPNAIGKGGEFSEWQLSPAVLEDYAKAHPYYAPPTFRPIAEWHLTRILDAGATTPEEVARKWNPNAPESYSQRVGNLYNDRSQQTKP